MQLKEGALLQNGKYEIKRVLGQGGFGITYLAYHTMLDSQMAIKEFFPKEYCDREESTSHVTIGSSTTRDIVGALKRKFIKEAKNISHLRHPNIITIHDIFEENSTAYYVMEFIEGKSLQEIIRTWGPIREAKAKEYMIKVAAAVGYMHEMHMNHLDIKPANIMIRNEDDEPILIDFGLSKQYDITGGDNTSTAPVGVSHGYAPSEQYHASGVASFTPQTDIYALGATLMALITGETPPHASDIIQQGFPEWPQFVSEIARNAIMHAMEVRRDKRPESTTQFIVELGGSSSDKTEPRNNRTDSSPFYYSSIKQEDSIPETPEPVMQPLGSKPADNQPDSSSVKQGSDNVSNINDIYFVDLGLNTLWASKNIGAKEYYDTGSYLNKDNMADRDMVESFEAKGASVPGTDDWEELNTRCRWEWTRSPRNPGYRVTGPNGKSIFLPVFSASFGVFGRLFTREAFNAVPFDEKADFIFYYSPGGNHKLTAYNVNNSFPMRLVMKK